MPDYSPHQRRIIERYYDRRDEIMLTRIQEIVTELYLAETDKKLDQLWRQADKAMKGLKVPPSVVQHILSQRKPEILVTNLRTWIDERRKT